MIAILSYFTIIDYDFNPEQIKSIARSNSETCRLRDTAVYDMYVYVCCIIQGQRVGARVRDSHASAAVRNVPFAEMRM